MMDEALKSIVREAVREALEQERPALVTHLRAELRAEASTPDAWLTSEQAAQHCGVGVDTIHEWVAAGLRSGRAGRGYRFKRSALDAWVAKSNAAPVTALDVDAKVTDILERMSRKR